jgi:hypothetical protein
VTLTETESDPNARKLSRSRAHAIAELTIALVGAALLLSSLLANQRWLDRHFLPSFFLPRQWYVLIETTVRVAIGALGVLALVVRRRLAFVVTRAPAGTLRILIAVLLACWASELVLRQLHLRPTEWLLPDEEPRRIPDPRLGWTWEPGRTGRSAIGGRVIEYAIDSAGDRVRRVDEPVDPDRPSLLFIGESVMFGEGLMWDETMPAQAGGMLGLQSVNLAVHGFSTDQAYLRLQSELPRFRRPVAVVAIFMTTLFGRNLDRDRPHLGPGLVWRPAEPQGRLKSLATLLVPYRSDATVERGISLTREVLRAIVELARARGATPLILAPQFGPEDQLEASIRRRVLDESLPFVRVQVDDGDWRLSWDRHPNARAAHIVADAIATRLRHDRP